MNVVRTVLLALVVVVSTQAAHSQVRWLEDASTAVIDAEPVVGQFKGKAFTAKFARIRKSGGLSFGESAFDHYTIVVQDAQTGIESTSGVNVVLTVPRGTQPFGQIFRRINSKSLSDQPGPGDPNKGVTALAGFYSLQIWQSARPHALADSITSGADQSFTGRVELTKISGNKSTARLYVCFNDPDKSCAAGTVEISLD